jgi:hypothetical protein
MFIPDRTELGRRTLRFLREEADYPSSPAEDKKMHISAESLIIILVVGLIAGWLACRATITMRGSVKQDENVPVMG